MRESQNGTGKTIQRQYCVAHIIRYKHGCQVIGWSDDLKDWQELSDVLEFDDAVILVATTRAADEALYQRWINGDREGIVERSYWNPNIAYYSGKKHNVKESRTYMA